MFYKNEMKQNSKVRDRICKGHPAKSPVTCSTTASSLELSQLHATWHLVRLARKQSRSENKTVTTTNSDANGDKQ